LFINVRKYFGIVADFLGEGRLKSVAHKTVVINMNVMDFLKNNVRPATGCTEPVAVAYATSLAYGILSGAVQAQEQGISFTGEYLVPQGERVESILIKTDRDVFKNALAVSIPGTNGQKGMLIASAMGLYCDPSQGLNLFSGVTSETVAKANQLLQQNKVGIDKVTDADSKATLDIEVTLRYIPNGHPQEVYVRLREDHDRVEEIRLDGQTRYKALPLEKSATRSQQFPTSLEEMLDVVRNLTGEERKEVYRGIQMNLDIADAGSKNVYGLGHGASLQKLLEEGVLSDNLITRVRIAAACAGDARMGGANISVMSTAGSGNQGITALIPVAITGEYFHKPIDTICEAAMLSHLVTKYTALQSGHLSALCGCAIKAGVGAAAGVTYLLGGNLEQINAAINIMSANITGMICDGAKEGCALKLSTAAGTATESALMALSGVRVPTDNGIIYQHSEDTLKGIGKISASMVSTDLTVVELMQNKC